MSTRKIIIKTSETIFDNYGADIKTGFAYIVTNKDFTIQCCLQLRKDKNGYKKEIDSKNCGADDGICGDVNQAAFEEYGQNKSIHALFLHMRKIGVKII